MKCHDRMCGAEDCERCFPFTWRQSALQCDEGSEPPECCGDYMVEYKYGHRCLICGEEINVLEDDPDDLDAPDADDPNEAYEPLTERQERDV